MKSLSGNGTPGKSIAQRKARPANLASSKKRIASSELHAQAKAQAVPASFNSSDFSFETREQLRTLLRTVKAVRAGDFSVRMPLLQEGIVSEIGDVLNDIIELNHNMASEFVRVGKIVGQVGRMTERVAMGSIKLQQVLKNLLSNAFKFTENGNVTLRLDVAPKDYPFKSETLKQARKVIAFSVTDTGIGIPREKQRLIFEEFQQADGTTSRRYGGTGLGLTISREIARLLGGGIEVESTPGVGSTFTLYLPQNYTGAEARIERTEIDPVPAVPALPEGVDFTGRKVLVVDDDMRNIYAITSVLESRGMKVVYAENGRIALKLLNENPELELVLMDTMMPEMDGIEATQEIRKLTRFAELPIISLTAKAMKGDREKAISAGASDYITKPVDPERLLSIMHMWFQKTANEPVNNVTHA